MFTRLVLSDDESAGGVEIIVLDVHDPVIAETKNTLKQNVGRYGLYIFTFTALTECAKC